MKMPPIRDDFACLEPWPSNFLQPPNPEPIIAPMTVGIAAICDNRKAIIMAADRLMTVGPENLATDTDMRKVMELTPQTWIAYTGTVQDCEYASERFKHASSLLSLQSVYGVAKRLRKACEHMRTRQIEEKILRPIWNVNFREYKRASLRNPISPIVNDVLNRILTFQYQLTLMVCGFDGDRAHIYRVSNSFVNSHSALGFHAIGYGETVATVVLARGGHNFSSQSIEETIFRVYKAKRAAEHTRLVGKGTDMVLLRDRCKAELLSTELIDECRMIYKKQKPPELGESELAVISSKLPPPLALESSTARQLDR